MRKIEALVALIITVCVLMSMPAIATNSPTANTFDFKFNGHHHTVGCDFGTNIVPADFNDTENTIPMNGTVVPCFKFVSENFDDLGVNDSRVVFGAIVIIQYDDPSVANPLMDKYIKTAIIGDLGIIKARNIQPCTREYQGRVVPVGTAYGANIDDMVKRKLGPINRGVSETRIMFGNFMVCLICDEDHFQAGLDSLTFDQ
jgi:hypothetical protein